VNNLIIIIIIIIVIMSLAQQYTLFSSFFHFNLTWLMMTNVMLQFTCFHILISNKLAGTGSS